MTESDLIDQVVPHWVRDFSTFAFSLQVVATIVIGWLPTPLEIEWRPYVLLYKTVQRISYYRPNWTKGAPSTDASPRP